jgi:hypothetical protein
LVKLAWDVPAPACLRSADIAATICGEGAARTGVRVPLVYGRGASVLSRLGW